MYFGAGSKKIAIMILMILLKRHSKAELFTGARKNTSANQGNVILNNNKKNLPITADPIIAPAPSEKDKEDKYLLCVKTKSMSIKFACQT